MASVAGRVGGASGFVLATGGLAVLAAAFFADLAGLAIRVGACLAAARFARAGRASVFLGAFFGAFFVAFLVVFARLLDACFFLDDGLAERRAATRGELRWRRFALLPVGRFLAMAV